MSKKNPRARTAARTAARKAAKRAKKSGLRIQKESVGNRKLGYSQRISPNRTGQYQPIITEAGVGDGNGQGFIMLMCETVLDKNDNEVSMPCPFDCTVTLPMAQFRNYMDAMCGLYDSFVGDSRIGPSTLLPFHVLGIDKAAADMADRQCGLVGGLDWNNTLISFEILSRIVTIYRDVM